jgi:ABC-type microcin C transport system duplicated ATPase subunit YejF
VVLNVSVQLSVVELREDLKQTSFLTISVDTKVVRITVRYLLPLHGMKVNLKSEVISRIDARNTEK